MNEPIDQPNRERFVFELDQNFSVVAAAGSGKNSRHHRSHCPNRRERTGARLAATTGGRGVHQSCRG